MFSKYDEVLVCPEAEILINKFLGNPGKLFDFNVFVQWEIEKSLDRDNKLKSWNLSISDLSVLNNTKTNFDAFIQILNVYRQKVKPDASTIIFKGDTLIYSVGKILRASDNKYNIKFISIFRDVRAVLNSQKNTVGSNNKRLSTNPLQTSIQWIKFIKASEILSENNEFYSLKYEDLISETDKTFSRILTKLKLNLGNFNSTGDLYQRIPDNQKKMHSNINNPPDVSRITAWKTELSKANIYLIENKTAGILKHYDYELLNFKINYFYFFILSICYYSDYYVKLLYKNIINLLRAND